MAVEELKQNGMMAHLLEELDAGRDIGHYGRLTFVMIARHFLEEEEVLEWLQKDKDCTEEKARLLVAQVNERGYNPPKRERILQWMKEQEAPICPDVKDPDACNVYKDLTFPPEVYEHIQQYRSAKMAS